MTTELSPALRDLVPGSARIPERGRGPVAGPVARAVAHAIVDAQARVCTHVPGCGATEAYAEHGRLGGSSGPAFFHEETAFAAAHGAGLTGARAACLVKTHGLAKAMNAVLSALSIGTTAGVVLIAFDDLDGSSSDNALDGSRMLEASEMPWERLDPRRAYAQTLAAFERSERLGLPVALLGDCRQVAEPVEWVPSRARVVTRPVERDPSMRIACPPMAAFQRHILETKLAGCHAWRDMKPERPLTIPGSLPARLRETARGYAPLFEAFRAVARQSDTAICAGDAGTSSLFGFEPWGCVDFCSYMGGSTSLALGAWMGGVDECWAVTGDFSFAAAGHLGLFQAQLRRAPLKVVILDNAKAAATGDQPVPREVLETLLSPHADRVHEVSVDASRETLLDALDHARRSSRMEILLVRV